MRKKLQERRKEFGYTQESIAIALDISKIAYQFIENGKRFPREKLMKRIMRLLKTKDVAIFDNGEEITWGDITKNICNYMNAIGQKKYSTYHVSTIRNSIILELKDRKSKSISIANKTNEGKNEIYKRIIQVAYSNFKYQITIEDILLYKKCTRLEFTDRTGKCVWGIPDVRKKLGFNPTTGY